MNEPRRGLTGDVDGGVDPRVLPDFQTAQIFRPDLLCGGLTCG